jgi:hypothetical protein
MLKQVVQVVHPRQTPCAGMDLTLHNPRKMRLCRLCRLCTPAPAKKTSNASARWAPALPTSAAGVMTRLSSCGSRWSGQPSAKPVASLSPCRRWRDGLATSYDAATYQLSMDRVQLNLRLPVPLVAALKTQAQQQGITLTALVEQQLSGDSKPASSDLAAIEQRLAALEQGRLASPTRVIPALRLVEKIPNRLLPATPPGSAGPITTAELAELLAVRRGTLNARISRAGGAAVGLELNGWRCVALVVPPRGGPARALWEPAG